MCLNNQNVGTPSGILGCVAIHRRRTLSSPFVLTRRLPLLSPFTAQSVCSFIAWGGKNRGFSSFVQLLGTFAHMSIEKDLNILGFCNLSISGKFLSNALNLYLF